MLLLFDSSWQVDDLIGSDATTLLYVVCVFSLLTLAVYLLAELISRCVGPPPLPPPIDPRVVEEAANRMRQRRRHAQDGDETCAICLAPFERPVELLPCSHILCEACCVELLRASAAHNFRHPTMLRCPTCRAQITLIAPCFHRRNNTNNNNNNPSNNETPQQIMDTFPEPLRRFNGDPENPTTLSGVVSALQYGWYNFMRFPLRIRVRMVLTLVLVLVYVISPLDLIPESVFGAVGYVDDMLIIIGCSLFLYFVVKRMFG